MRVSISTQVLLHDGTHRSSRAIILVIYRSSIRIIYGYSIAYEHPYIIKLQDLWVPYRIVLQDPWIFEYNSSLGPMGSSYNNPRVTMGIFIE